MKRNPYRLPEEVRPVYYDLFFEPDIPNFRFDGTASIHLRLLKPLSRIVLHAADLKVRSAEIFEESGAARAARTR